MDTELFELCREVYEKTGWDDDELEHCYTHNGAYPGKGECECPLYTSDYLLEKLPTWIEQDVNKLDGIDRARRVALQLRKWNYQGDKYFAEYHELYYAPLFRAESDTPLKALLKLTIALHDKGAL